MRIGFVFVEDLRVLQSHGVSLVRPIDGDDVPGVQDHIRIQRAPFFDVVRELQLFIDASLGRMLHHVLLDLARSRVLVYALEHVTVAALSE